MMKRIERRFFVRDVVVVAPRLVGWEGARHDAVLPAAIVAMATPAEVPRCRGSPSRKDFYRLLSIL